MVCLMRNGFAGYSCSVCRMMVDSACIRQLAQHGHHHKIQRRVEARGRFVENQQFGAEGPVHAVGCELGLEPYRLRAACQNSADGIR